MVLTKARKHDFPVHDMGQDAFSQHIVLLLEFDFASDSESLCGPEIPGNEALSRGTQCKCSGSSESRLQSPFHWGIGAGATSKETKTHLE